jgi:hypothetical protein
VRTSLEIGDAEQPQALHCSGLPENPLGGFRFPPPALECRLSLLPYTAATDALPWLLYRPWICFGNFFISFFLDLFVEFGIDLFIECFIEFFIDSLIDFFVLAPRYPRYRKLS